MVDSSIGGKTGIDTPTGKNLIGAFHQPQRVYVDLSLLASLPKRELVNGMAEVIKHGCIKDAELFDLLESQSEAMLNLDEAIVAKVIGDSIKIKADVVIADELEGGLRAILNWGHSVGHGIEAHLQPHNAPDKAWLHGECVSVGCMYELEIARAIGGLAPPTIKRVKKVFQAYGLPVDMPQGLYVKDIIETMAVDKKNKDGKKHIVLLNSIGETRGPPWTTAVDDQIIERILAPGLIPIPRGPLNGAVRVPGSKSISNRVLLLAALGHGECRIRGLLHSDDTQVMLAALQQLGLPKPSWEDAGEVLVVQGAGGNLTASTDPVYLSNAGTAARFLTTVCTLVKGNGTLLTGNKRMHERPIKDLVDALHENGCSIDYNGSEGCLPLAIKGGGLPGGTIRLAATVSSQYVSSLLIAAPLADTPITLILEGHAISQPYIEMTIQSMAAFGIKVTRDSDGGYLIPLGAYSNPSKIEVEGDASSASYALAVAAITGGGITVSNVGSDSIQGDAAFCSVMESMGCKVSQTGTTTHVQGPPVGQLKAVEVDMEPMTDTFMTAAVVMAAATGVSKIHGVANQRVKECDRIAAMVKELGKCGITARELEDGIEVVGNGGVWPVTPTDAHIECYHDHRIAMSFAVLGCARERVCITDQRCTDKTYPEFWDHCKNDLDLDFHVFDPDQNVTKEDGTSVPPSVVLTGMRAAGKTSLAEAGKALLGLKMVDMDHVFRDEYGQEIKDFVKARGGDWVEFRQIEAQLLLKTIAAYPTGAIIACGGGIVESKEGCAALKSASGPVIWCQRPIDDIVFFLQELAEKDPGRPSIGDVREVYARRAPLYAQCSTHVFSMGKKEDKGVQAAVLEFGRFLRTILHGSKHVLTPGSFCLSLTYADYADVVPVLAKISEDSDVVEIRADLLKDTSDEGILKAISFVRRTISLPFLFTVRSKAEGGKFEGPPERALEMLRLAVRAGTDLIDVERDLLEGRALVELTKQKGKCLVVCSHHQWTPRPVKSHLFASDLSSCAQNGVDLSKVVWTANDGSDCAQVRAAVSSTGLRIPCIALLMGEKGKLTRVLNSVMSLVTHESLAVAAPGQMSVKEVQQVRQTLGLNADAEYPETSLARKTNIAIKAAECSAPVPTFTEPKAPVGETFGYYPFGQ